MAKYIVVFLLLTSASAGAMDTSVKRVFSMDVLIWACMHSQSHIDQHVRPQVGYAYDACRNLAAKKYELIDKDARTKFSEE